METLLCRVYNVEFFKWTTEEDGSIYYDVVNHEYQDGEYYDDYNQAKFAFTEEVIKNRTNRYYKKLTREYIHSANALINLFDSLGLLGYGDSVFTYIAVNGDYSE